jgi:hypothetical protein
MFILFEAKANQETGKILSAGLLGLKLLSILCYRTLIKFGEIKLLRKMETFTATNWHTISSVINRKFNPKICRRNSLLFENPESLTRYDRLNPFIFRDTFLQLYFHPRKS